GPARLPYTTLFRSSLKEAVLAAVRAAPWNRYPPFAPTELLERLAARHGWVADGVLVGNGSNELIQATLSVTVGAGTPVVTPVPTFSLYRLLAAVYGGRHVPVPLTPDFEFDVDALARAACHARARAVVVNSPNNPTGTPFPDGAVERLLAETEALVVMDEAYQDFGGPTAIPLLPDHPRLVVLRTFSKAMSLAGLRFGYALAHPAVATGRAGRDSSKAAGSPRGLRTTWRPWVARSTRSSRGGRDGPDGRSPAQDQRDRRPRPPVPRRHRPRRGEDGNRLLRPHAGSAG